MPQIFNLYPKEIIHRLLCERVCVKLNQLRRRLVQIIIQVKVIPALSDKQLPADGE